ncbi:MAG: exosortase C-terminal domain/associated protein EpsI [Bryobacteraceae bacterium]|jgi:EpsI family protein
MRKPALILTFVFLAQAGLFYGLSRGETTPVHRPFSTFPDRLGDWKLVQHGVMEDDVKNVLRGDDYITAWYAESPTRIANLFVAYFNSQRSGQSPHSPKNCLPGSGWVWSVSDEIPLTVPGRAAPITVNRYIVSKADAKDVVLYWYQSRDRVVASEYKAMVFVAADALRYNRTDTSLVRVIVPITNNQEQLATQTGIDFIQSFFGILRSYLPA